MWSAAVLDRRCRIAASRRGTRRSRRDRPSADGTPAALGGPRRGLLVRMSPPAWRRCRSHRTPDPPPAARTARRASARAALSCSTRRPACARVRHSVAGDATSPNSRGCAAIAAMSQIASPPSATITAASTSTRPRSWPRSRCSDPAIAAVYAAVSPRLSARSANSRAPAWVAMPRLPPVNPRRGRVLICFTTRVPFFVPSRVGLQPQDCHIRRAFPRHGHPDRPLLKISGLVSVM